MALYALEGHLAAEEDDVEVRHIGKGQFDVFSTFPFYYFR